MASIHLLLAFLMITFTGHAHAAEFEIVQSVPVETTLDIPGIRQTQPVWLEMIRSAQTQIDIEQMYITSEPNEALEPVLQALEEAANRGVTIRLIADVKFYKSYPESVDRVGKLPHAEARIIDFSTYGGIQHAKYFIIDGKTAFFGSQNFDWRALTHIHEVGVRTTEPKLVSDLSAIFAKDWGMTQPKAPSTPTRISTNEAPSPYRLVASPQAANPAQIGDTLSSLLTLINSASKTVQIEVMDFSTKASSKEEDGQDNAKWTVLYDALIQAAKRGVQVQLMIDVSHLNGAKPALQGLVANKNIQVRVVTIPQWSGGAIPYARMIHSKFLIADGQQSWIGTENWTRGYFLNTRNVGVVIQDANMTSKLSEIYSKVWNSGYAKQF